MLPAVNQVCVLLIFNYLLLYTDLHSFLQYVTGCPSIRSKIEVLLSSDPSVNAISANTCGDQLVLSTLINDEEVFQASMRAIIPNHGFTMI